VSFGFSAIVKQALHHKYKQTHNPSPTYRFANKKKAAEAAFLGDVPEFTWA
jgi:hypothetical protein